jgi:hypothetical protein
MKEINSISDRVVEKRLKLHVYTYKLGKEEILWKLAERFNTKCVVSEERY